MSTENLSYWERVRYHIGREAQTWSKGSEARAMLEILVIDEGWQETLLELAGPNAERLYGPSDCACMIMGKYFEGAGLE
jgi:hypothetical protein